MACFIYIAKSGGRAPEHPFRFDEGFFCFLFLGGVGGGGWGGFSLFVVGFFWFCFLII